MESPRRWKVWRNGGGVECELGCEQIEKRRHLDRGTNLNTGIRGNREEQHLLRTARSSPGKDLWRDSPGRETEEKNR